MTTGQIYWGAVPFVMIQLIMVALIITFPGLVSGGLAKKAAVNTEQMQIEVPTERASATARRLEARTRRPRAEIGKALTSWPARAAQRAAPTP